MNTDSILRSTSSPSYHSSPLKLKSNIYKFVSIIQSQKEIKSCCNAKTLVTWLSSKDAKANSDLLGMGDEGLQIASRYAEILEKYFPEADGTLPGLSFNYRHLVKVIERVFRKHLIYDLVLFNGIRISIKNEVFMAQVSMDLICIAHEKQIEGLGKSSHKNVISVYEIATCKIMAFKSAKTDEGQKLIRDEYSNLNELHKRASALNKTAVGIQEAPIALFNFQNEKTDPLVGFLGAKYDNSLLGWLNEPRTNKERITLSKQLVCAYQRKEELGYWHGDLKPENILVTEQGVVLIDWEGSILYEEAAMMKCAPKTLTRGYLNYQDLKSIQEIIHCRFYNEYMKKQLVQCAKTMELFALGINLYIILVGKYPFDEYTDFFTQTLYPYTLHGLPKASLDALYNKNYSLDIQDIVIRMLAHQEHNRCSFNEVITFWETIQ